MEIIRPNNNVAAIVQNNVNLFSNFFITRDFVKSNKNIATVNLLAKAILWLISDRGSIKFLNEKNMCRAWNMDTAKKPTPKMLCLLIMSMEYHKEKNTDRDKKTQHDSSIMCMMGEYPCHCLFIENSMIKVINKIIKNLKKISFLSFLSRRLVI